ncbi:hypothetical protein NDU88_001681 [Pleurodeles waltl]|uniref:Uncharacterized protein n=1 Tax=Pleurodeles waltl TaxID=8319 RepID=A0AAV7VXH5_PLEWA|nr:hypothetical protein NDU88_001681 [Pleurodeles waltl]
MCGGSLGIRLRRSLSHWLFLPSEEESIASLRAELRSALWSRYHLWLPHPFFVSRDVEQFSARALSCYTQGLFYPGPSRASVVPPRA